MTNKLHHPSYKLGSEVRKPLAQTELTPGPGSYLIPGTNDGPRVFEIHFKLDH